MAEADEEPPAKRRCLAWPKIAPLSSTPARPAGVDESGSDPGDARECDESGSDPGDAREFEAVGAAAEEEDGESADSEDDFASPDDSEDQLNLVMCGADLRFGTGGAVLLAARFRSACFRSVVLAGCHLEALPAEITRLPCLVSLDVAGNDLATLPTEVTTLSWLEVLSASANRLRSVPRTIARLARLRILLLSSNRLRDFPFAALGSMGRLEKLELGRNYIEDLRLPPELLPRMATLCRDLCAQYVPTEVVPRLFLGGLEASADSGELAALGIRRVLSVGPGPVARFPGIAYLHLEAEDHPGEPLECHFEAALAFIGEGEGAGVLVHCFMGFSRSATLVAAHLVARWGKTTAEALALIRHLRPFAGPNPGFVAKLEVFEAMLRRAPM
jgi:hypothetical protein